jgi:ABC-type lipoprotein export system ATPase subunit
MFQSRIRKVISELNVFSLTKNHIPDNIKGIIVLGSSGSGKTTFINHASTPHRRLAALILHHQRLANISPTKRLSECFVEKHNEL